MFCFQCLEPFHFPITAFFGLQDKRCDEMKVYQWRFFTKAKFELVEVGGNHLFPLDKDCKKVWQMWICLLYTSPSPRDRSLSRMPSSA